MDSHKAQKMFEKGMITAHELKNHLESPKPNTRTVCIQTVDLVGRGRVLQIMSKVKLGMNCKTVRDLLGEPDDISVVKNRSKPIIYKYNNVELHFSSQKENGELWLIYTEDKEGNGTTHARK